MRFSGNGEIKKKVYLSRVKSELICEEHYKADIMEKVSDVLEANIAEARQTGVPEEKVTALAIKITGRPGQVAKEFNLLGRKLSNYKRENFYYWLIRIFPTLFFPLTTFFPLIYSIEGVYDGVSSGYYPTVLILLTVALAVTTAFFAVYCHVHPLIWWWDLLLPAVSVLVYCIASRTYSTLPGSLIYNPVLIIWIVAFVLTSVFVFALANLSLGARQIVHTCVMLVLLAALSAGIYTSNSYDNMYRSDSVYTAKVLEQNLGELEQSGSSYMLYESAKNFDSLCAKLGLLPIRNLSSSNFKLSEAISEVYRFLEEDDYVLPMQYRQNVTNRQVNRIDSEYKAQLVTQLAAFLRGGVANVAVPSGIGASAYREYLSDIRQNLYEAVSYFYIAVEAVNFD